jgi:polyribonucleotide nucleotidyltransferase
MMIVSKSVPLGKQTLTIETGRLARQADGAVTVRYGDTIVLVTIVAETEIKEQYDFLPLSVEYREKSYAAGKIPGGFFKREGRPSDKEVLSARLIDRPLRPLFPEYYRYETQIVATIISMDKDNDADVLAAVGASAALCISDIPFDHPVASVRVGKRDGQLIVNPTLTEVDQCVLELVVAGNEDSILMVEGEAREISESEILEAIAFAHVEIKKIVKLQNELRQEIGKPKRTLVIPEMPAGLAEKIEQEARPVIKQAMRIREKQERRTAIKTLNDNLKKAIELEYPEYESFVSERLFAIEKEEMRQMMRQDSLRLDGRRENEIRPIVCEISYLPRAHGSALFTRGQTQSLGTVTLGTKIDEQMIDALEGESYKAFMLHYNFPPFSTGEVKPFRGTSRREIGHGNLAERAFKPVLPLETEFPYTIRIVSDILESNGSSSMASVCSGSLALMDAGVPIRTAVAGIAMGLIKEEDKIMILSDILGDEDHMGDMDFKVAGTGQGITAVQMDIKIKGISFDILATAMERAREGRLHILQIMNQAIATPRKELSRLAPRIEIIRLPIDKIGIVIGPGGKTIKSIIDQTGVKIDIEPDGNTVIASELVDNLQRAKSMIMSLVKEPEVGEYYKGVVKRITNFGAFVEIAPGKEGMIHISELDIARVNKITDVVNVGDTVEVLVKRIDAEGKIGLSRKEYLLKNSKKG